LVSRCRPSQQVLRYRSNSGLALPCEVEQTSRICAVEQIVVLRYRPNSGFALPCEVEQTSC